MELMRQPVLLLLLTLSAGFGVFLAAVPYFGFGDDPKMVKDTVMAAMLLAGLFGAVLSASASVSNEIRSGTALAVLSKPVGRAQFILAKYTGLAGILTLLTYGNMLSALIASKTAYDAYGDADLRALGIYFGLLALGFVIAGFINFFLGRPFVADAIMITVVMMTVSALIIFNLPDLPSRNAFAEAKTVDWRIIPASFMILLAFFIFAGIAIACSTRMEMIPTLSICTGIFLLGLMSDYLFGRQAELGTWWASILYTALPNWQLFWLADALESEGAIPLSYVGKAFGYAAAYVGAVLSLALILFEDRELN